MRKAIEIRNLNFKYPDRTEALRNINLDIYEGESIGIIGPNGAGKTTLLLHLNGLLNGTGKISVFGLEVEKKNLKEIRRNIGLVFQDPEDQLFMPTVFEDVAFGPTNLGLDKEIVKRHVDKALRELDLIDKAEHLSHHLSFGEKKRVSIATVLSMNPSVLVLDEPSSNLDPKHRRDVIKLLKGLRLTKIIATHDLEMVLEVCSRVALVNNGKVISEGNVRDMLSNKTLLEANNLEVPPSLVYH